MKGNNKCGDLWTISVPEKHDAFHTTDRSAVNLKYRSVELIGQYSWNVSRESLMCLCHKCRQEYILAGYTVQKAQIYQINTDICTRCNFRSGFDYYITGQSRKRLRFQKCGCEV